MTTLKSIITNKYLWITIIMVGLLYWGKLYITQTSRIEEEVVYAKLKFKKNLYGVDFPSSGKGWIVGEDGLIARSVDKGENWEIQESGVTFNLVAVCFLNTQTGFAAGAEGTLLMTENGGDIWGKRETETEAFLNDICFTTPDNGFVVGESGTLLSTKDGGETWKKDKSLFKDVLPWQVPELKCIYFVSPECGWIVGEFGTVLKTVDRGLSWNKVDIGTDDTLFGVCFFDQNNGYIVGIKGLILATEDGGKTWVRDKTFKRTNSLYHVAYLSRREKVPVYIAGHGILINLPSENYQFRAAYIDRFILDYTWLYDMAVVSPLQAYIVGKSGLILHIARGEGDLWEQLDYNVKVKR